MKVALVTGGGTGIGRLSAIALASIGFTTVVTGRRRAPLERVVEDIRSDGGDGNAIPADITSLDDVSNLFEEIRLQYQRLDVLFNNAGVNPPGDPPDELTVDQWRETIDSNLTGSYLCTREAFRLMKSQHPRGGRIINNGSISAHVPRPNSIAYTASKHAITGLTRSTALDGRKYNIVCGQIDIGNADTAMTSEITSGVLQADGSIRQEPSFSAEHVADAIAFIATLPLDVSVPSMTITASGMPYIGRG